MRAKVHRSRFAPCRSSMIGCWSGGPSATLIDRLANHPAAPTGRNFSRHEQLSSRLEGPVRTRIYTSATCIHRSGTWRQKVVSISAVVRSGGHLCRIRSSRPFTAHVIWGDAVLRRGGHYYDDGAAFCRAGASTTADLTPHATHSHTPQPGDCS